MEKTHHSALVVVPPDELQGPIQAIRLRHDRQVHRWMPHVNLVYPFVPQADFDRIEPAVREACEVEPFPIELGTFRLFEHRPGHYTVWLAPEPAQPLRHLASRLRHSLPGLDDLFRFAGGFTPHLSVGQSRDSGILDELQRGWSPVRFVVERVALISRHGDAPFAIDRTVALQIR